MNRPVALVTGASSGIGEALAREFAANGHDLIITARRQERLEALATTLREATNCEVLTIGADLATKSGVRNLCKSIRDADRQVDVLVNNAGVAQTVPFSEMQRGKTLDMVQVNVRALTELTQALAPAMVARRSGKIMNVCSVAGFSAVPGMAVYSATKAFVLSLSESLSEEFRNTGVSVTALCPGLTKTEMASDLAVSGLPDFLMATPESVAKDGFRACMRGDVVCVPGQANQAFVAWLEAQPRWLARGLAGFAARSANTLLRK